jgi:PAS domain-containing protein
VSHFVSSMTDTSRIFETPARTSDGDGAVPGAFDDKSLHSTGAAGATLTGEGNASVTRSSDVKRRTKAALTMFNVIIEKFLLSVTYKNWRAHQIGHICAAMASFNVSDPCFQEGDDVSKDSARTTSFHCATAPTSASSHKLMLRASVKRPYVTASIENSHSGIPSDIRHHVNLILDKILMRDLSNCSQWLVILLTSLHDSIVPIMLTAATTLHNATLYVNEGFVNTFGFSFEEVKGKNAFELLFQHSVEIGPDFAHLGYLKDNSPFMSMVITKEIRSVSGLPLYKLTLFPISPGDVVISNGPIPVSLMESKRAQRYYGLMNTLPDTLYVY